MGDVTMNQFHFAVPEAETQDIVIEFADGMRQVPAHLVTLAGGKTVFEEQADTWKAMTYQQFEVAAETVRTKAALNTISKQSMLAINRQQEGY